MADGEYMIWGRSIADKVAMIYQLQEGPPQSPNATQHLISTLIFSQSKSVRTSTVILATFNMLAASAIASSILYDCYVASKRQNGGYRAKKLCVTAIHPAETLPLVMALGIFIQSAVFAGTQAVGLSSLFIDGCAVISQFVFPAIFVVPYIQMVFSIECALRSVRKGFPARGKYDVSICIGVIFLMLVGTWIPTHVQPESDHCFASLSWYVARYGELGAILFAIIIGVSIISASTIFYRLTTSTDIEQRQRIAASRMVHYLIIGVLSACFILPWFVTLTKQNPSLITSMMATVVLNLQGLKCGLLQLFLRANTAAMSFKPRGLDELNDRRHEIRLWGPNELGFDSHMLQPVSGPRSPSSIGSRASLIIDEKSRSLSVNTIRSPKSMNPEMQMDNPVPGEQSRNQPERLEDSSSASTSSPLASHSRKQSYSLFPLSQSSRPIAMQAGVSNSVAGVSPERRSRVRDAVAGFFTSTSNQRQTAGSTYDINDVLQPPPSLHLFGGGSSRHRRDSSMISSATVQIGLRLSHAIYDPEQPVPAMRPWSPVLRVQTQHLPPPLRTIVGPSPLQRNATEPRLPAAVRDARMKTLPPVPRMSTITRDSSTSGTTMQLSPSPSAIQLSPTVYSPQSGTKGIESPPSRPVVSSPLWRQQRNDDMGGGAPRGSKVDWI